MRLVYFPAANTHENLSFRAKLGIQTWYDDPIQFPAFVQLNGALLVVSTSTRRVVNRVLSSQTTWECAYVVD